MASKGKKAVSQEELRRLMREKQRAAERQRRVQSPFAKYTSAGRLTCSLCGEQVKSEAVWQAHVLGRGHKERVGRLKEGQEQGLKRKKEEEEQQQGAGKRAKEERKKEEEEQKRGKEERRKEQEGAGKEDKSQKGLPAGFFQSRGAAGLGLLAGQYGGGGDDDDDEEEEEGKGENAHADPKPPGGAAELPADFFESAVPGGTPSKTTGEGEEQVEEGEEGKGTGAKPELPEGFFDDPVRDARVRNVDTPREQMDREWEEFQKEMRLVNNASDAIVAEDDEEGRIERQIDEIDEQIECFRRVELLRARQEAAQVRTAKQRAAAAEQENRQASENDEEDEEELLHVLSRDWRAKGALA